MATRSAPGASTVALVVAVALAIRLLVGRLGKQAYDGLAGVISFSSKMIAAARAVEAQEKCPLVVDPLAAQLAGSEALASSRRRAESAPKGSGRMFKIGKMAIRTRWFDDQIQAALGMPVSAGIPGPLRAATASEHIDMASYVWRHPDGHQPRQLVMLGAGMDSRPWRMKLPADLHWFELDQADVVEAKQEVLKSLAAEVPVGGSAAGELEEPLPAMSPKYAESGLERAISLGSVRFPLRCASWTAVPCDLQDPSWADALLAAGFDPSKPTVWVAEGLLMYLDEADVKALLAKLAELSVEGSAFVGISVTQAVIDRINAKGSASELMGTWKFGCPPDPTALFAECGWKLQQATDRARQAAALGLNPELCSFPTSAAAEGGTSRGTSLFMTATPSVTAAVAN
ncbi:hypothetical protein D9Q98_005439 [Chlorella vulgaris]|uniref:S-adenosyl-L-methionine-dependent methyltransferase n=1 Tax=Chlorella vulgaris TaxID=3077 RepID=A0A9D4TM38_CHLVU|nr:hypothetical protein D9Q98_005439 [Chlorella vulgaris]